MNYTYLLGHAWEIVRRHRFIWWLGLLAMFTEGAGGGGGGNFQIPSWPSSRNSGEEQSGSDWSTKGWPALPHVVTEGVARLDSGLFSGGDPEEVLRRVWEAALPYLGLILVGLVLLFLLWLVLLYFSYTAQAGLILSVQELEERRVSLGFSLAMDYGKVFFWRLLGMNLLLGFGMLLVLLVLAVPVVLVAVVGQGQVASIVVAVVLGILFLLLFVGLALYLSLLVRFAARRLVLANAGILDALTWAHGTIRARLGPAVVSWLVALAVQVAYGLAMALVVLVVVLVLGGIGVGIWAVAKWAGVIVYAVLVGGILVAALLVVGGVYTGFVSTYWTLVYRAFEGLSTAPERPGPWSKPVVYGKTPG